MRRQHRDSIVMGKVGVEGRDFGRIRTPGFSRNERATRLWARRSRLSQLRVKWLVTGSWESAETWIRNSIHEASRRISDSSHLLSTRPPRSLPTCYTSVNLRPTSKQMCPLAVYGPQATKLKKLVRATDCMLELHENT